MLTRRAFLLQAHPADVRRDIVSRLAKVHIPTVVFLVAFFYGHHFRSAQKMWLDKLCIHQTREEYKEWGLKALPAPWRLEIFKGFMAHIPQ